METEKEIERLFNRFCRATDGDRGAAATLALACVQLGVDEHHEKKPDGALLTVKQAAERLNVSQKTVRRLIDKGDLIPNRVSRGSLRFDPAHLEDFTRRSTGASSGRWP